MAIFRKDTQQLLNDNKTLYEVVMVADQYGRVGADSGTATSRSAFGEVLSVPVTPVIQLDGLYGLDPQDFEIYDATGGAATTTNTLMQCSTGTSLGGYGVVRSKRAVRYRPGQGALARFTAKFSSPVNGYTQRAGFFTQEQAIQVGYFAGSAYGDGPESDSAFGVLRQNGGKAHIHEFEVTVAESGADVSVTIDNDVVTLTTSTATASSNAAEIAAAIETDGTAGAKWIVEQAGAVVRLLSRSVGVKSGTFSIARTSGSTFAGATTVSQEGVAHTSTWVPQSSFNVDKLDGTGPSGMTLDPTKLNVFQINFRWLGAGEIRFAIENSIDGEMVFFHHIHYSNQNTDVHIDNPSLKIGYVAASLGGTGDNIIVEGASMMGAIEGVINPTKLPIAHFSDTGAGQNLAADTWHHLLTIKNSLLSNDKINSREIIFKNINSALTTSGNPPITVALILNLTGTSTDLVMTELNTYSTAHVSNTTATVTLGAQRLAYSFSTSSGGSTSINLNDLRIAMPPGSSLSVLGRSTGQITRSSISLSWIED